MREAIPGDPGETRTLVGVRVAETPENVSERVTLPLNPFTLATVMVEVPCDPSGNDQLDGYAEMLTSARLTVMVILCDSRPSAPITIRVYFPLGVDDVVNIVKVEEAVPLEGRVGLLGLKFHVMVGSFDASEALKLIEPERPLRLVNVTVVWPGYPMSKLSDDELA